MAGPGECSSSGIWQAQSAHVDGHGVPQDYHSGVGGAGTHPGETLARKVMFDQCWQ